jgi:hypothetical protein
MKRWHSDMASIAIQLQNQRGTVLERMQLMLSKQQYDAYGDKPPASPRILRGDIKGENPHLKEGR